MCAATDGSGYISIFDSVASMGFSIETILQLGKIYSIPANHSALNLKRQSVQQQKGSVDCGLFSIAFAVEICSGENPDDAIFAQEDMRLHILKCFTNGKVTPFPRALKIEDSVVRPKLGYLSVEVFCYCKMPAQFDTEMIQCDTCQLWYHYSCVHLDTSNIPDNWECPRCCKKN